MNRRSLKRLRNVLGCVILAVVLAGLRRLPEGPRRWAMAVGAGALWFVWPPLRVRTLASLRAAGLETTEAAQTGRAALQQTAYRAARWLTPGYRGEWGASSDLEAFAASLRHAVAAGRGAVVLTAHAGDWEGLLLWGAAQGLPLTVVARRPRFGALAGMATRLRRGEGVQVLWAGPGCVRGCVSALRAGRVLVLVIDRQWSRRGLALPFLGRRPVFALWPARLALQAGAAVFACVAPEITEGGGARGLRFAALREPGPMAGAPPRIAADALTRAAVAWLDAALRPRLDTWIPFDAHHARRPLAAAALVAIGAVTACAGETAPPAVHAPKVAFRGAEWTLWEGVREVATGEARRLDIYGAGATVTAQDVQIDFFTADAPLSYTLTSPEIQTGFENRTVVARGPIRIYAAGTLVAERPGTVANLAAFPLQAKALLHLWGDDYDGPH